MGELLFVTGGARSGKSAFAERIVAAAATTSRAAVTYVATLEPLDAEMRDRIARHQAQRPVRWTTVEAPLGLAGAYAAVEPDQVVLVDCLSLWVSNRLLQLGEEPAGDAVAALEAELLDEIDRVARRARQRTAITVVVSNEVGSGIVPPSALGRVYRDLLGRANQSISRHADRAWLLVAGRALELSAPDATPGGTPRAASSRGE
jgi:adenosylcobinamide kinase/adenosylcobinamide-phosphate guanylyltransferase